VLRSPAPRQESASDPGSDGDTFGSSPVWFFERIIRDGWHDTCRLTGSLRGRPTRAVATVDG
jgi:hypothetical protein